MADEGAPRSWLLRHSAGVLKAVNTFYVLAGGAVIAMGLYGLLGKANVWMPEKTGKAVVAFGAVVVLTALLGFYGTSAGSAKDKTDAPRRPGCRRCALLIYFVLLALALVGMLVMGAIVLSDPDRVERSFQRRWTQMSVAKKAAGQLEFACCGFDASAALVVPATTPASCNWNDAAENGLLMPCPQSAVDGGCTGCRDAAVAYLKRHFRAGFIACLATGVATVLGVWLSGYLLCRFEPNRQQHVDNMNRYDSTAHARVTGVELAPKLGRGAAPATWAFGIGDDATVATTTPAASSAVSTTAVDTAEA